MYEVFASKSDPNSGERLLNAFLRVTVKATKAQIIGRSGLVSKFDLGGEVRAQVRHRGKHYVVAGGGLWRIGKTAEYLGDFTDGQTRMESGATQIGIAANGAYYVFDSDADELSKITPGVIETVTDIAYMDGYMIVCGVSGGRGDCIQISALNDATEFNALDFAFAEGSDDVIVACIVDHGEFWAIGSQTIEKYYNDGGDFPLQRNVGTAFDHGCHSTASVTKADNRVFWIGEDRVVYVGSGGELQVISPRWVDEILREVDILGMFSFRDRGTPFIAVRLHGRPAVVYDITTGLWHERSTGLRAREWVACSALGVAGVDWIGTTDGNLCIQDQDIYRDAGTLFEMEAQSAPIIFPDRRVISRLQILHGGGSQSYDRTPQVMLQITKDGKTWGRERWRALPNVGQHAKTTTWRALGQARHWQARLRITDEVSRDIEGVFYE